MKQNVAPFSCVRFTCRFLFNIHEHKNRLAWNQHAVSSPPKGRRTPRIVKDISLVTFFAQLKNEPQCTTRGTFEQRFHPHRTFDKTSSFLVTSFFALSFALKARMEIKQASMQLQVLLRPHWQWGLFFTVEASLKEVHFSFFVPFSYASPESPLSEKISNRRECTSTHQTLVHHRDLSLHSLDREHGLGFFDLGTKAGIQS